MSSENPRSKRLPNQPLHVYICTQGCTLNRADTQAMSALLEKGGHQIVRAVEEADAVIFNTCTVKDVGFRKFRKRLKRFREQANDTPIIIAGCIPKANPDLEVLRKHHCIGPDHVESVVSVVEAAVRQRNANGQTPPRHLLHEAASETVLRRISLQHAREQKHIEIVPISKGCLGNCAYCKTKAARGHLVSYPVHAILERVRNAVRQGVTQIWLTSQDCGCYGLDIGVDIISLLREIQEVSGDFIVRIGMANPQYVHRFRVAWAEILQDKRFYSFLHVPVQSGSDAVLRLMNRSYSRKECLDVLQFMRTEVPDITIATDIIIGHPGEGDKEFAETQTFLEQTKPEVVNRSRFVPQPKTPAAEMDKIDGALVKQRMKKLDGQLKRIWKKKNLAIQGELFDVVSETHKKAGSTLFRSHSYRPVIVEGEYPLGTWEKVRIIGSTTYHLKGQLESQ
ncbi:MAG: tRNA (N(6)-L-threonylcarbamoyladenosine(37)-C(2))-methylthiotransferase [Nanoarchaeota archaeon]